MTRFAVMTMVVHFAFGLFVTPSSQARDSADGIRACRDIAQDAERLQCFDLAVQAMDPPTYQGRLSLLTEPFELDGPAKLRFQSDGAIFVLYVKDADGTVLQNLHIGGGGEDIYRIAQAGKYRLQINGSEGWRIWVEPENREKN
jgi:hypothetical protein